MRRGLQGNGGQVLDGSLSTIGRLASGLRQPANDRESFRKDEFRRLELFAEEPSTCPVPDRRVVQDGLDERPSVNDQHGRPSGSR